MSDSDFKVIWGPELHGSNGSNTFDECRQQLGELGIGRVESVAPKGWQPITRWIDLSQRSMLVSMWKNIGCCEGTVAVVDDRRSRVIFYREHVQKMP